MRNYINYLKNRRGQGTTEYIIILAIAVSLSLLVFWSKIKPKLETKVGEIGVGIDKAGKD